MTASALSYRSDQRDWSSSGGAIAWRCEGLTTARQTPRELSDADLFVGQISPPLRAGWPSVPISIDLFGLWQRVMTKFAPGHRAIGRSSPRTGRQAPRGTGEVASQPAQSDPGKAISRSSSTVLRGRSGLPAGRARPVAAPTTNPLRRTEIFSSSSSSVLRNRPSSLGNTTPAWMPLLAISS